MASALYITVSYMNISYDCCRVCVYVGGGDAHARVCSHVHVDMTSIILFLLYEAVCHLKPELAIWLVSTPRACQLGLETGCHTHSAVPWCWGSELWSSSTLLTKPPPQPHVWMYIFFPMQRKERKAWQLGPASAQ